ncbi:uncharacterized protein [Ptychodera flava]|uniref:uncharacterized protein isoform X2 n=1 Tax=Ptychodera flava TaxID=63121 RepID=UPI00396A7A40
MRTKTLADMMQYDAPKKLYDQVKQNSVTPAPNPNRYTMAFLPPLERKSWQGGFKIQLLDHSGTVIYNLTESDDDGYLCRDDTRRENYTVTLPANYVCSDCILRVRREVSIPELQLKRDYLSCADIVIQENLSCPSDCSDNGACINGTCMCDRLYKGDACQYQDECEDDIDCGDYGRCLDSQGTFYPKKKCFCQEGYFGVGCQANPTDFNIDVSSGTYNHKELNENINLYWKILEKTSEIEMVVQALTNNWITLGWKPADISIECSTFPVPRSGYPDQPDTDESIRPMYCADMVVGMAVGSLGRVRDLYSRDQSTPREDVWYGGTDSLTAATATEVDGITTVAFRRLLTSAEQSDHNFTDSDMMLVWARGRQQDEFYQTDEFKGHELGNSDYRGSLNVNFFDVGNEEGSCYNEFRYPSDCILSSNCMYFATWTVDEVEDEVHFEVVTADTQNHWVGIGFSEDTAMPDSDAIIGWVTADGELEITDRWMSRYAMPPMDDDDNIYNKAGSHVNGITSLSFSRKRITTDDMQDLALNCLYILFPIQGGTYDAENKRIGIHSKSPLVSTEKVCFDTCQYTTNKPFTVEEATTAAGIANSSSVGLLMILLSIHSIMTFSVCCTQ